MCRQIIFYYFIACVYVCMCTASQIPLNITVQEGSSSGNELVNLKRILNDKFKRVVAGKYKIIPPQKVAFKKFQLQMTDIQDTWFEVNKNTGALRLSKSIDRESLCGTKLCSIQFKVFVSPSRDSEGQPYLISINANIQDVNDNAPTFPIQSMVLNVSENRLLNDFINLDANQAKDYDIGENSRIRYAISSNPYFKINSYFDVNKFSHLQLKLKRTLDYEEDPVVDVVIRAKDFGQPSLSSSMKLIVNVIDENDNYPIFEKSKYTVVIDEGSSVNRKIIQVKATDKDSGVYGKVKYHMSARNPPIVHQSFEINETTGAVTLKKPLDREASLSLNIRVEARDSAPTNPKSHEAFIEIIVQDVNDNSPRLEIGYFVPHRDSKAFLLESSNSETYVADLSVKDYDAGVNGEVDINLTSTGCILLNDSEDGGFFNLTEEGVLQSTRSFDREECGAYNITIRACDRGQSRRCTSETIQVEILDENEFAPKFLNSGRTRAVREDAAVGYVVATFDARDYDSINTPAMTINEDDDIIPSKNGEITYAIDSGGGGHFSVGYSSGILKIAKTLDREKENCWKLVVSASDGGSPRKRTTAEVTINVEDVNDNAPRFIQPASNGSAFNAYLLQNGRIAKVEAVDDDDTENGKVVFSLVDVRRMATEENPAGMFLINQITGELRLNLSSENASQRIGEYQLTIKAKDKGKPSLQSYLQVTVHVNSYPDDIFGSYPTDVATSSVFKDPYFMTILLGSLALLMMVFVILAFVRCRRIKRMRDAALDKDVDYKGSKEIIDSKLEYQDNSLPYDIFRPESCPSVVAEPQDNNATKETILATKETSKSNQLCPQQSDSDSGRGDSDLDGGTCGTHNNTSGTTLQSSADAQQNNIDSNILVKASLSNTKCGEQCRKYGHGDSCWMPELKDENAAIQEMDDSRQAFSNSKRYNTHYHGRSATEHRRKPLQKANSFGYGSYSSLAVNLNTVNSFSLPRSQISGRPHSNPNLQEARTQTPSPPSLTASEFGVVTTHNPVILHSTNTSAVMQRSYSLRDDRNTRIHRMPTGQLETVYETEDMLPNNCSSGHAPLLVRQPRIASPFPYPVPSCSTAQNTISSFYPNSISPSFSIPSPIVTGNPGSNINTRDVECKIANYEYML